MAHPRMTTTARLLTAAFTFSLLLGACGSSPSTTTMVTSTTTGQQLTDLKAALDQGVITQSEYDKKKKEILRGS